MLNVSAPAQRVVKYMRVHPRSSNKGGWLKAINSKVHWTHREGWFNENNGSEERAPQRAKTLGLGTVLAIICLWGWFLKALFYRLDLMEVNMVLVIVFILVDYWVIRCSSRKIR
jgi:hypothetical protein